jgi:hypothetical protein
MGKLVEIWQKGGNPAGKRAFSAGKKPGFSEKAGLL